ncbi:MAG: peroxidase-related enzyme [Rhizobiales bacterium]|nr:peroxidase-related enzyme [Hyphomicrobiales bacterium]
MTNKICWIDVVDETVVGDRFDSLRREDGSVHNLYRAFSQFPEPVVAADKFYRDIMHSPDAPLPMWLAELLSVDVAIVNECTYAAIHHGENFLHLYGDREAGNRMIEALKRGDFDGLETRTRKLLEFGRKLTTRANEMSHDDIAALREAGYNDAEISQAVQVTASFAYWTRLINALGISLGDEKIGKY